MAIILLSEALQIFHSGKVCSLTYVAADKKRGTGGKLIHIPQCVIYSQDLEEQLKEKIPNLKFPNPDPQYSIISNKSTSPNHYLNKTRNIYIPATRSIQKLHIKLITAFNGKKVLL